jgi:hypothetical protein
MSTSHRAAGHAAPSEQKISTAATGLAAWLGGVAFCVGLGVSGPTWLAAVLTVLSMALVAVGVVRARRGR